jgi:hypothetical protein
MGMGLGLQDLEKEDDFEEEVGSSLNYRKESCLDAVSAGPYVSYIHSGSIF